MAYFCKKVNFDNNLSCEMRLTSVSFSEFPNRKNNKTQNLKILTKYQNVNTVGNYLA